jgi:hypothetical protein
MKVKYFLCLWNTDKDINGDEDNALCILNSGTRWRYSGHSTQGKGPLLIHVGPVVAKVGLKQVWQVFSMYFGFPCQCLFNQMFSSSHLSSGAGKIQWAIYSLSTHHKNLKKLISSGWETLLFPEEYLIHMIFQKLISYCQVTSCHCTEKQSIVFWFVSRLLAMVDIQQGTIPEGTLLCSQ